MRSSRDIHKQAAPWRHEVLRWESRQALADQAGFAPTASGESVIHQERLVDGDRSELRDVDAMYERIDDQRMSAEAAGRVFAHMIAVRGVPDHGHAAQAVGLDAPQL